jgi:hypothetical protein
VAILAGSVLASFGVISGIRSRQAVEAEQVAAARFALSQDLREVRVGLGGPAADGRHAAASLRTLLSEAVLGSDRRASPLEEDMLRRVAELRDAADRLEERGRRTLPEPPPTLAAEVTEVIAARLEGLDEQAVRTAVHLRRAADAAERSGLLIQDLTSAAAMFAADTSELVDSDEPEVLATAWRAEAELLAPYRDAAETTAEAAAAGDVHPAIAELAAAHLAVIDHLAGTAAQAADDLEAGRVEDYNQDRQDALTATDDLHQRLVDAIGETLDALLTPVEAAEERALGLLTELEALRRDSPAQFAAAAYR